jgi:hypothetical protein
VQPRRVVLLGHRSRRWSDIEGSFVVIRVGLQSVIAYRLTGAFKASARIRPAPSLAGNDEAILICGELAMGAGELVEVLNRWKQGMPSATKSAANPSIVMPRNGLGACREGRALRHALAAGPVGGGGGFEQDYLCHKESGTPGPYRS